jgi:hypothetical protein
MKNKIILAVLFSLVSLSIFAQKGGSGVIVNPAAKPSKVQSIDLKAESITFTLVRRIDANRAIIKVEGVIKNVGTQKYVSLERQQGCTLSEVESSTTTIARGAPISPKKDQLFSTLDPGATLKISYEMEWYKGNEFPPMFMLEVTFDPDIRMDGNLQNDDAVFQNNRLVIDGKAIINAINW